MEKLWSDLLDFINKLVSPDWGALVGLVPLLLLLMVVAYLGWLARRYMSAGPRQRGGSRIAPRPPAGVHAPGPSYAPVLAAIGLFVFLYGLVFRGWLPVGTIILILTLLYWLREGIHDYDHLVHADDTSVAVVPRQPPPGVHMPGPSFRPILVSIALAVLLYGLVFGGWLLLAGVLMLAISLLGWLRDARAEYRAVVVADATGHLSSGPRPGYPTGTLWTFAFLFIGAAVLNLGILPPKGATGGTVGPAGATGAPGPGPGASAPGGGPPADVTITAQGITFTTSAVTAPAGKPFTIKFQNDDAGVPHNVHIHNGSVSGASAFKGDIFPGVDFRIYNVPALAAGTYAFQCDVHPAMTGTLTVQ